MSKSKIVLTILGMVALLATMFSIALVVAKKQLTEVPSNGIVVEELSDKREEVEAVENTQTDEPVDEVENSSEVKTDSVRLDTSEIDVAPHEDSPELVYEDDSYKYPPILPNEDGTLLYITEDDGSVTIIETDAEIDRISATSPKVDTSYMNDELKYFVETNDIGKVLGNVSNKITSTQDLTYDKIYFIYIGCVGSPLENNAYDLYYGEDRFTVALFIDPFNYVVWDRDGNVILQWEGEW